MGEWDIVIRLGAITRENEETKMIGKFIASRGSTQIDIKLHAPYDPADSVLTARQNLVSQALEALQSALSDLEKVPPQEIEQRDQPPNTTWTVPSS